MLNENSLSNGLTFASILFFIAGVYKEYMLSVYSYIETK